jgi:hypothetical protein
MLSVTRDVNKLDQELKSIRFGRNGGRNTLFLIKITKFLSGRSLPWQHIANFHARINQLTAMRVAIEVPEELISEVMKITGAKPRAKLSNSPLRKPSPKPNARN